MERVEEGGWYWTFTENEYKNQMNFYQHFDPDKYEEERRLTEEANGKKRLCKHQYCFINPPKCSLRERRIEMLNKSFYF